MIKRWLARRFRDDETAKWTLSIFCGGGALVLLMVDLLILGIRAVARMPQ